MDLFFSISKRFALSLIVIIVVFIAVAILIKISVSIRSISSELRYLDLEIRRTNGSEKKHWKRKKKRLLASLIFPFVK